MLRDLLRILTVFVVLFAGTAFSQARGIDPAADSAAVAQMRQRMDRIRRHRPTVALVLSGGGAKGTAHVGVLKYIESLDIPVDMVLGTSMGGLIGGLYALGYSVDKIDSLVRNMDWEWAFSDRLSREYITYSDMRYKEKYLISIPFYYESDYYRMKMADEYRFESPSTEILHIGAEESYGLRNNLLGSLPSGYIYGQNVSNLISSLTVGYQDEMDFQNLPIPFVCIATDMVSGKAKVWHSGKINDAMRSTMSIPGIFAPVKTDGMVLVDGGMRDNYPTALAREMGADIIIGVDLSSAKRTYSQVNNIGDIIGQGIDMLGRETFERNVNIPDVKIRPDLKEFNMLSFSPSSVDTIIHRGYLAACARKDELEAVAAMTVDKGVTFGLDPAFDFQSDSLLISEVKVKGVLPKEEKLLMERLHLKFNRKISRKDLDHIIAQIYGTQSYDFVTYELLGESEPFKLVLNCKKGPVHQLGLGVRADTEEIVSVLLNVGFYTHRLYGHSCDFTGKISANPYFRFHWYYDTPSIPTINASASIRWTDLGMLDFGRDIMDFDYLYSDQEVYFSNMTWNHFDVKTGVINEVFRMRNISQSQVEGRYDFSHLTNDYLSLFADVRADTFDNGYFPTRGFSAGLSYSWTFADFRPGFNNFHTVTANARVALSLGNVFTFIPSFNARMLLGSGDVPVAYFNAMGGSLAGRYVYQQMPFIGITSIVDQKNILTIYRSDLRFRLSRNHYLTGIVNYARDCDVLSAYAVGKGSFGAGVEYSYNTIFGPLSANVHWSDLTGRVGVYVSAGFNF